MVSWLVPHWVLGLILLSPLIPKNKILERSKIRRCPPQRHWAKNDRRTCEDQWWRSFFTGAAPLWCTAGHQNSLRTPLKQPPCKLLHKPEHLTPSQGLSRIATPYHRCPQSFRELWFFMFLRTKMDFKRQNSSRQCITFISEFFWSRRTVQLLVPSRCSSENYFTIRAGDLILLWAFKKNESVNLCWTSSLLVTLQSVLLELLLSCRTSSASSTATRRLSAHWAGWSHTAVALLSGSFVLKRAFWSNLGIWTRHSPPLQLLTSVIQTVSNGRLQLLLLCQPSRVGRRVWRRGLEVSGASSCKAAVTWIHRTR